MRFISCLILQLVLVLQLKTLVGLSQNIINGSVPFGGSLTCFQQRKGRFRLCLGDDGDLQLLTLNSETLAETDVYFSYYSSNTKDPQNPVSRNCFLWSSGALGRDRLCWKKKFPLSYGIRDPNGDIDTFIKDLKHVPVGGKSTPISDCS
ncbi:hypothetical protein CARUB_v10028147mg [Capsella rubella]|uniref:S-protein homolog n=1 Tax=Capsella rubella TaxID=81985 RepID=R0EZT3_9BRAS|nr:hypothetical protein CARUB_v10028147mg [Capsella rubella]